MARGLIPDRPPWDERELCRVWFEPALTDPDREWIRYHLGLAGRAPPHTDISWLQLDDVCV
jgi:hypothetical protein